MAGAGHHLSIRIQCAAVALVALVALTLAFLIGQHQRDNQLAYFGAELGDGVRLNGKRLRQVIDTLRQDTLFLSRVPPISGIARADGNHGIDPRDHNPRATWVARLQEIFAAFTEAHPDHFRLSYVGIADGGRELVRVDNRDGRIVVAAETALETRGDQGWFREAAQLREGEIHLSEFDLGAGPPGVRTLRAVTPIRTAAGELFGLVVVSVDVGTILDAVSNGLPPGAQAYIADDRGRSLVRPDRRGGPAGAAEDRPGGDFPALAPFFDPAQPAHLPLQAMDSGGKRFHVTATRLHFDPLRPERFLVMAYALPDEVLQAHVDVAHAEMLLGGLGLALGAAALMLLAVRQAFSPLHRLTGAALAIARGEREVGLPAAGGGEVGALTAAFRRMLAEVAARERELLALTGELEDRVKTRTAELRLAASVFDNTSEGVMVVDDRGRIASVNRAFAEITGYGAEEAIGQRPSLLKSDHHDEAFYRALWSALLTEGRWQGEIWNRRKDGEAYLEWLTINRIPELDGIPASFVGVFNDITELRRKDEHIRHLAFHDALTGLPNRALMQDRLRHAVERSVREDTRLAVMFIDLDHFKAINDSLGHDVGDLLLQEVAKRLKACLRSSDTVARLGGDEFVVLLENLAEPGDATAVADNLIAAVARPLTLAGHATQVAASVGISLCPEDGCDAVELTKRADMAMYAAKSGGRNGFRFFSAGMAEPAGRSDKPRGRWRRVA